MIENYIVAFSNVAFIHPIRVSLQLQDRITATCIVGVTIASFISHLLENHKHGMPGIFNVSKQTSYLLNRLDVVGCGVLAARIGYVFYTNQVSLNLGDFFHVAAVFTLQLFSEYDKYNPTTKWYPYIPIHCLWHATAAHSLTTYITIAYQ